MTWQAISAGPNTTAYAAARAELTRMLSDHTAVTMDQNARHWQGLTLSNFSDERKQHTVGRRVASVTKTAQVQMKGGMV